MSSYEDLYCWSGIIGCVLLIVGVGFAAYAASRKCRRMNKAKCYGVALILGAIGAVCIGQTMGYIDIPGWQLPTDKL